MALGLHQRRQRRHHIVLFQSGNLQTFDDAGETQCGALALRKAQIRVRGAETREQLSAVKESNKKCRILKKCKNDILHGFSKEKIGNNIADIRSQNVCFCRVWRRKTHFFVTNESRPHMNNAL
jgi:hypothetical protein